MTRSRTLAAAAVAALAIIVVYLALNGRQDPSVVNLTLTSDDATRLARGDIATPGPGVLATAEAEFAPTPTTQP